MADDDLKDCRAMDRSRGNVNEPHEVSDGDEALGRDGEQLAAAVKQVGVSVAAVAKQLGKK
jgi:hypothetical protein